MAARLPSTPVLVECRLQSIVDAKETDTGVGHATFCPRRSQHERNFRRGPRTSKVLRNANVAFLLLLKVVQKITSKAPSPTSPEPSVSRTPPTSVHCGLNGDCCGPRSDNHVTRVQGKIPERRLKDLSRMYSANPCCAK